MQSLPPTRLCTWATKTLEVVSTAPFILFVFVQAWICEHRAPVETRCGDDTRFCKNKQTSFIIRRRVGRPQQRVVSFQACSICLPASLAGLQQATLARPATLHRRPPRARAASMPSCPIRRRGRRMRGTARAPILYKQGARAGRTLHARPGILHLAHPALTKFVGKGKDCCIMLLLRCWGGTRDFLSRVQ
jgi:hypothetical protein